MMRIQSLFSTLSILAGLLVFAVGCGRGKDSGPGLQITPDVVDLGTIASTGQSVTGKLKLFNPGPKEKSIHLTPACACVLTDQDDFTLQPGADREVSFSLSSYGRSGDFQTQILVKCPGGFQKVSIRAVFVPQVFAFPSRVVLLSNDSRGLSGEFTIEAPKDFWQVLELQAGEGIEVSNIEEEGGKRRYRVVSKEPRKKYAPIILRKHDQEAPVLTIPVMSGVL